MGEKTAMKIADTVTPMVVTEGKVEELGRAGAAERKVISRPFVPMSSA